MLLAIDCLDGFTEVYPLDPVEDGEWAGMVYVGRFYTLYTLYFGY